MGVHLSGEISRLDTSDITQQLEVKLEDNNNLTLEQFFVWDQHQVQLDNLLVGFDMAIR